MGFWERHGTKVKNEYEMLTVSEFRARFNDEKTPISELIISVNSKYDYLFSVPRSVRELAYTMRERR